MRVGVCADSPVQAMFDYNVLYDSTNPITAMLLFMVYEVRYVLAVCWHRKRVIRTGGVD